MKPYCCEKFKFDIEIGRIINCDISIREYFINFEGEEYGYQFFYCFYCGKKLPKSLSEEREKATKHIEPDDSFCEEWEDKLPKKYKTDVWWKELGLDKLRDNEIEGSDHKSSPSDKHCCYDMENTANYDEEGPPFIAYEEYIREYFFVFTSKSPRYRKFSYCIYCGRKLPKNLKKEWKFLLEKEFGIKDIVKEWRKIPEEFKTEEWWRKRDLEKISKKEISNKDIFFPTYKIGIDLLFPTEKNLAIDICNGLIEEEFSAQDIVDIIVNFDGFVDMILYPTSYNHKNFFLHYAYISRYIFFEIRDEILLEIEPERYKEEIEALVEKHRQDIIDLAKKLLKKITKDDAKFTEDLIQQGFSKSDIEKEKLRKERLKQEKTEEKGYGRHISSHIGGVYFNQDPRIGENKLKMILNGRICRSKEQCKEISEYIQRPLMDKMS